MAGRASRREGEIREQYHHAIDLVPTILDALGVEPPETIGGHVQSRFDGVSMRYSFDARDAAQRARRRSSTRCSARAAIWHDGWKAVTTHPTISGWSHFDDDTWELYHTDVDRSELHDLAAAGARAAAGADQPLVRRGRAPTARSRSTTARALEIILTPRPLLSPARNRYVYYPDLADVPESQAVNIRNRSYAIGALVDIPAPGAEGVLFAHGSRFGGHALYVKDNRLHYVYNFVGSVEQKIVADRGRCRSART